MSNKLTMSVIDLIFICSCIRQQMKRTATILATLIIGIITSTQLTAQCDPDTVNCKDVGDPGQFCPLELPRAGLGVLYDELWDLRPLAGYTGALASREHKTAPLCWHWP